jgi:surface polysaccharide O-acyltransferase-like enzyme
MIEAHLRPIASLGDITEFCWLFAAPLFIMVSGIGYQFFLSSRRERGNSERRLFFESLTRAIVLFALTLIPSLYRLITQPSDFGAYLSQWSVFQVIAVGYAVGVLFSKSLLVQVISIPAIMLLSIAMSSEDALDPLTTGLFPLFPYLAYFLIGQTLSRFYLDRRFKEIRTPALSAISIAFFLVISTIVLASGTSPVRANQSEPVIILLMASILLLFLVPLMRVADRKEKTPVLLRPLGGVGKIAFSSYYLHRGAIYALSMLFAYLGLSALPAIVNPILLVVFIAALALLEWQWKRINYFLGMEWFLRKGSALLMRSGRP